MSDPAAALGGASYDGLARLREIGPLGMVTLRAKGLKGLEKAAFKATYNTMWCAGQSVEMIDEIKPVSKIIETLVQEYEAGLMNIPQFNEKLKV